MSLESLEPTRRGFKLTVPEILSKFLCFFHHQWTIDGDSVLACHQKSSVQSFVDIRVGCFAKTFPTPVGAGVFSLDFSPVLQERRKCRIGNVVLFTNFRLREPFGVNLFKNVYLEIYRVAPLLLRDCHFDKFYVLMPSC